MWKALLVIDSVKDIDCKNYKKNVKNILYVDTFRVTYEIPSLNSILILLN